MAAAPKPTRIGLAGLAVMGQNLALNIAEKGFPISVYNRSTSKVDETVAGSPVDQTIKTLSVYMEKGDCIIDGGNEWYENTERREKAMAELGLLYLGMGVSGGEEVDAEAYDVLKSVGKLSNDELHSVFTEWNKGEGYLVDKVLDKTGMKGTGNGLCSKLLIYQCSSTIASSLDARFLSGGFGDILTDQVVDKKQLIDDVRQALYASKICSYAQGMNLIRAKSIEKGWDLKLGELARIWKGGCIIRAVFLDRMKRAYDRNADLANLLVDPEFAKEIIERQSAWRRVVCLAINSGISTPGMSSSLAYFDTYRRARLPANLVQAQRDYFGAHTYERVDVEGSFHTEWFKIARQLKN
uniref:phosphogluconate dehydrogenase (NADP(+)-dependent, decarboxylating) n=1 Tax=Salix viminalis TaxID=40686 RepID=A0A6N2L1S4_SALVM